MATIIFLLVVSIYIGVLTGFVISWIRRDKFTKEDERMFREYVDQHKP